MEIKYIFLYWSWNNIAKLRSAPNLWWGASAPVAIHRLENARRLRGDNAYTSIWVLN